MIIPNKSGIVFLKVNPYGGKENDVDTVSWYCSEDEYFIFFPSDIDSTAAKVYFKAAGKVIYDDKVIVSGAPASAFTEGAHSLVCGDKQYKLTVCYSANIPAVFIKTSSGSLDYIHANKENKESGYIRIYENGIITLDKDLMQIKGRGNATWLAPKKPYNINFDEKTSLFGMGKAKKWTLLANYFDESLLRNVYGWEYAKALGLHYTSDYQHIDLFINGEYQGDYVICESVEVGSERININDLDDDNEEANPNMDLDLLPNLGTGADNSVQPGHVSGSAKWIEMPNSPDDISGGYLLEYDLADRYDEELSGFVTENGQPVTIKSPELASKAEVLYIQAIVNDAIEALYSDSGYNAKGKHYTEYYDMDSFVNMYILQELSSNIDAGFSSLYMYKSHDSDKLVFSPIWDMDHAFGDEIVRFGVNNGDPTVWWANSLGYSLPTVFNAAFRHNDFKAAVHSRWEELTTKGILKAVAASVDTLSSNLSSSGRMNIIRWNSRAASNPDSATDIYASTVFVGQSFIQLRCVALTKGFSENAAMLYYDANGGSGNVFNPEIALIGESVTVIDHFRDENQISPPNEDYHFTGWNTSSDGNGELYMPGDNIILADSVTVLYAQWQASYAESSP